MSYRAVSGDPWISQAATPWRDSFVLGGVLFLCSAVALGLRFGDGKYYNVALEAGKAMSDEALDTFNRRTRYSVSFSYQL